MNMLGLVVNYHKIKQPTAQKQISMKKRRATLRSIYNDGLNADDILCPKTEYI